MIYYLFEERVMKSPNAVALVYQGNQVTYRQLSNLSRRIARSLEAHKIRRGDFVLIYMDNSTQAVASILASFRLGAVAVPVHSSIPWQRAQELANECAAKIILHDSPCNGWIVTSLKWGEDLPGRKVSENSSVQTAEEDPAVCIFTSGSTGRPKGVLLSYAGLWNHIKAKQKLLALCQTSVYCLSFKISFVASLWQILAPLTCGAKLVIPEENHLRNAYQLFEFAERYGVHCISVIPQTLKMYLAFLQQGKPRLKLEELKSIVLTGEQLDAAVVNAFYTRYTTISLINAYGLSETSDDILHYRIPRKQNYGEIPLGVPVDHADIYILDDHQKPCAEGEAGELYVSGSCVALGFCNTPWRNCLIKKSDSKTISLLPTGDIVHKRDGLIYYLGRSDHQIKIRGHRLQPEEIERTINQYPGILRSIVLAESQQPHGVILCAFYCSENAVKQSQLRSFLAQRLPDYMVPTTFHRISEFSYTSNGKIDRKKLWSLCNNTQDKQEAFTVDSITARILPIVKQYVRAAQRAEINSLSELLAIGVDSFSILSIILALEKEFGILLEPDKIHVAAFRDIRALSEYVHNKLAEDQ